MKLPLSAPNGSLRPSFVDPAFASTSILRGPLLYSAARPRFVLPTLALLAGVGLFSSVPSAKAATKYWEPTGSTGTNASGTWNTTGVSWTTDSTGASGPNTTFGNSTFTGTFSSGTVSGTYTSTNNNQQVLADDAVFSADPAITAVSTVTLGANLGANSITFGNPGVTNGGAASGFTFAAANILSVGSFTATGANTYTGNTAITLNAGAGPVIFNNQVNLSNGLPDAAGASTINYSIANNSTSALTFNGIFVANTRPNNTNDTVNLTFSGTGGVTFNGALTGNTVGSNNLPSLTSGGGNFNLIINGGGAVALNAANVANGSVALSNGSLTLGNSLAMQALALNQTGGTFSFGTLTAATIAGLTGTSNLTLTNSGGAAVALNDVGFSGNGNTVAANPTFAGNINGLGSLTINGVEKSGSGTGGTATFSGVLSFTGANGLTINDTPLTGSNASGASTVVLTNANTYTGPTSVTLPGGSLTLNGNGSITGTSAITLNGGLVAGSTTVGTTTLVYDNTVNGTASRLGSAPLTLNGSTLNYRPVTTGTGIAGTGSAGAITIGGAQTSAFNFANASTGNTSNFTIASLANANHGTLSATLPNANSNVGFITLTTAPTLINGILPWTFETTNNNFLSTNSSNQLNAYGNAGTGTDATTFNNTATSNVKIGAAQGAFTGATAENSLVYNVGATQAFGGNTLTLTSGGLALTNSAAVLGSAANDGSITTAAANPELFVNTTAAATINSAITNNGSTSVALTKFGTGTLSLGGTNTYSGPTTVEQGTLSLLSGSAVSSTATVNAGATLTNLGTLGGLVLNPGSNATLFGTSVTGPITDNGVLTIPAASAAFTAGTISGTGNTGTITYANTNTTGNTLGFASAALASLTDSANAGPLTANFASGANSFTTVTDSNTANPLNINTNGSSTLALTTLTSVSGSTVSFGGDGTGSTTIANQLQVNGALLKVTAGTVTLTNGRQTNDNIEVDGGSLIFNTNRFSTQGTNQTLTITGGLVQANANSGFGFRLNGDNGPAGAGTAGAKFNATQTGGTLLSLIGGSDATVSLGSTSATQTSTYSLSGGVVAALGSGANGFLNIGADVAGTSTSTFTLSGTGVLIASQQVQGDQGAGAKQAFVFNGGTLTTPSFVATNLTSTSGTAVVTGTTNTLTNNGGTLAPGFVSPVTANALVAGTRYTGKTTITGNYTQNSTGALGITLGGTTASGGFATASTLYDNVAVSGAGAGNTTLGGRLNVGLNGAFTPTAANTFTVLTSTGTLSGTFNNFQVVNPAGAAAANPNTTVAAGGTGAFNVVVTPGAAGTVVLNSFAAGNTYTGSSTAWDAGSAASWSVYDPGSSTTASGAVAQFGNGDATAGAATVSLNSTRNVAGILFNSTNTGATNYTISQGGSGAVVLDNTGAGGNAAATITDSSAAGNANAINVPITLNSPLAVSVTSATTMLTLGGAVTNTTAQAVTKTGAGALLINGSLGSTGTPAGVLTVSAGTLGGAGILTVTSATVSAGSTLAPGATLGATTGALTLNTTTGLTINGNLTIGVAGSSDTFLQTNGLLTLGGATLTINGALNGTSNYDIANYGTLAAGSTFASITPEAGYTINYAGTTFGAADIELDVTAVPEPSTWTGALLLMLGAFGIKLRRKLQVS